jgi:DNA-binding response OmpR family regulator
VPEKNSYCKPVMKPSGDENKDGRVRFLFVFCMIFRYNSDMAKRKSRILIVEDDPYFNTQLAQSFKNFDKVDRVTTLAGAFRYVAEYDPGYDVIILDRSLHDGDGLELVPLLQQDFPKTTICVLSGLCLESEQAHGLQKGAHLYLCKPLSATLVRAHVIAFQRPQVQLGQTVVRWRDLILQTTLNCVRRADLQVQLTKRETQFLGSFLESDRGEVTHDQLFSHFWTHSQHVSRGAIHVTVQRLRTKLQQLGLTIVVHYGSGYRLQENT